MIAVASRPFRKRIVRINLDHVLQPRLASQDVASLRAAAVRRGVSLNQLMRQITQEWLLWEAECESSSGGEVGPFPTSLHSGIGDHQVHRADFVGQDKQPVPELSL